MQSPVIPPPARSTLICSLEPALYTCETHFYKETMKLNPYKEKVKGSIPNKHPDKMHILNAL